MAVISETIRLARVLCIFFVMFVHVYSGHSGFPVLGRLDAADIVYRFMVDVLGRSSLPLLSIISGWLLAELNRPHRQVMRARLRTLLVPLAAWNALMLAALLAWAAMTGERDGLPASALELADALFALTDQPANIALGFLRDLFVVSALSPLVVWSLRRFGAWPLLALFVLAAVLPHALVLLRTQILFFFALGIWLHQVRITRVGWRMLAAFALFAAVMFALEVAGMMRGQEWHRPGALALLNRICVSALVWHGALALARMRAGRMLARLEPFTFLAFCSHVLVFAILAVPGRALFGDLSAPLYPLYFFLQPPLGYAAALGLALALRPVPPLLRLLNAGRHPWTERRPARTVSAADSRTA